MEIKDLSIQIMHKYRLNPNGETNNSRTYIAQDLNYERDVFIKEIDTSENESKDSVRYAKEEAKAMIEVGRKTTHVPIVYEYFLEPKSKKFYIVMQMITGETLAKIMEDETVKDNKQEIKKLLDNISDICDVLQLMYRYGYYHKDIKPANIMRSKDREGRGYLIDFGSSVKNLSLYNDGTQDYQAPEMSQKIVSADCRKADIFSLGVIMYEFFTGKRPQSGIQYKKGRASGPNEWSEFVEPVELNQKIIPKINSIIIKCMKKNPKDRYDIRELKKELINAKKNLYK